MRGVLTRPAHHHVGRHLRGRSRVAAHDQAAPADHAPRSGVPPELAEDLVHGRGGMEAEPAHPAALGGGVHVDLHQVRPLGADLGHHRRGRGPDPRHHRAGPADRRRRGGGPAQRGAVGHGEHDAPPAPLGDVSRHGVADAQHLDEVDLRWRRQHRVQEQEGGAGRPIEQPRQRHRFLLRRTQGGASLRHRPGDEAGADSSESRTPGALRVTM